MHRLLTVFVLFLMSPRLFADVSGTGSDNFSTGCATVEYMAKMVAVNILLPGNSDSRSQLESMQNSLKELNRRVCQSVILTDNTRYESRYSNGTRISRDLYRDAWYFPNGQLFMAGAGRDVSIYYPNGRAMNPLALDAPEF